MIQLNKSNLSIDIAYDYLWNGAPHLYTQSSGYWIIWVMELALKFTDVTKYYGKDGKEPALDGVSLEIEQGSFVGLVGGNGAGKTTLIKCLLDFCDIQSGQIEIFNTDHRNTEARSRLAFLPERFTPPYFVTGNDFLRHMLRMHQEQFESQKVDEIITALDLDPAALKKPVHALSKGMAQKLGLAAVLMSSKDLLVLDEPMSGLDPKARVLLKSHLLDLKASGKTLFFSTHLLADVETLCDKIVILHNGKLQFTGSPSVCCDQYGADTLEEAYISSIT